MSRFNVEYNGKWACFSIIENKFITKFVDEDKYEEWRRQEYGDENFQPVRKCNTMAMEDSLTKMKKNRTPLEFYFILTTNLEFTNEEAERLLVLGNVECCKNCDHSNEVSNRCYRNRPGKPINKTDTCVFFKEMPKYRFLNLQQHLREKNGQFLYSPYKTSSRMVQILRWSIDSMCNIDLDGFYAIEKTGGFTVKKLSEAVIFGTEEEAINWLNNEIKPEYIPKKYRRQDKM